MRRLLDYTWPVAGGVAAWLHCLVGDDRMARWLRTNSDYEPAVPSVVIVNLARPEVQRRAMLGPP